MNLNELSLYKSIMLQKHSRNDTLLEVVKEWHNIFVNQKKLGRQVSLPCYLNYERYGNGMDRYLMELTGYLKAAGLVRCEGKEDYTELYMEYTEGRDHPSLERLIRYMEEGQRAQDEFAGVILLHIDEWCSNEFHLRDKRFRMLLQYLGEHRSGLLILFQTSGEKYAQLLERMLQQYFNIRVIESMPLPTETIVTMIEEKLLLLGLILTEDARRVLEEIVGNFRDIEEIDCFRQIKLIKEDIIFEYMKNQDVSDMVITGKHLEYSLRKSAQLTRKESSRCIGFDMNRD